MISVVVGLAAVILQGNVNLRGQSNLAQASITPPFGTLVASACDAWNSTTYNGQSYNMNTHEACDSSTSTVQIPAQSIYEGSNAGPSDPSAPNMANLAPCDPTKLTEDSQETFQRIQNYDSENGKNMSNSDCKRLVRECQKGESVCKRKEYETKHPSDTGDGDSNSSNSDGNSSSTQSTSGSVK